MPDLSDCLKGNLIMIKFFYKVIHKTRYLDEVDVRAYSSPGGRKKNEDAFLVADGLYAVCDGLGGHENGEVASICAINTIKNHIGEERRNDWLLTIIEDVNRRVFDLPVDAYSTIVIAFIWNGYFYYNNVGDSRIYYFREGRILAQSIDDTVCQKLVDQGKMDPKDIRIDIRRSYLLRVLGNDRSLSPGNQYMPIAVQKGDAFLLCSDGLWEFILEEEMEDDLIRTKNSKEWMNKILKRQNKYVHDQSDNYTIICGRL